MQSSSIESRLRAVADARYAEFQRKLLPTVAAESVVGVRTPVLRQMARSLMASGEGVAFIERLPHATFDENQLHVMILSLMKDYDECLNAVKRFLPYIDNWATCDQLTPKVFARHADELLPQVEEWVKSEAEYTIRFGMKMLMSHYLGERFHPDMPKLVAAVHREEYYIRMMQAWYFATALAKQWDSVVQHIETPILDPWTHNKAIQKAIESYRISTEQKDYLRTLKVGTGTQN